MRGVIVFALAIVAAGCREVVAPTPQPPVAAVYVRFPAESVFVGTTARVTVVATGEDSVAVAWPQFTWESSDTTVAVVDSTGMVLGLESGTTIISATLDTLRDSITVRVTLRDVSGGVRFSQNSAGENFLCALSVAGTAYCSPFSVDEVPPLFTRLPGAESVQLVSLSAASRHQCGLTAAGQMFCWGWNSAGEFLTGSTTPSVSSDAPIAGGGTRRFTAVAVGSSDNNLARSHTCGIDAADGRVLCAGYNNNIQLGRTGTEPVGTVAPTSNNLQAARISASAFRTCALDLYGTPWCWGGSQFNASSLPATISPFAFTELHAGDSRVCAIELDPVLRCMNVSPGSAATGTLDPVETALRFSMVIAGTSFLRVSPNTNYAAPFVCGLTNAGALYCWGDFPPRTISSRLGDRRLTPVPLARGVQFRTLGADRHHVCGVTTDNRLVCL